MSRFNEPSNRFATAGTETIVGCLGILEARKGHRYLLEAASLLKSRGLKVKCLIGGDGSLRSELEKQADRLGLNDAVQFLGFVSDAEGFLAGIDVLVMPSLLYEGLGVAALEAMAASKAVIAGRVGGLAESVVDGETGLLVPAQDANALADAIARLAGEPERARQMGRRGRARVCENFTMERWPEKTNVLLRAGRRDVPRRGWCHFDYAESPRNFAEV